MSTPPTQSADPHVALRCRAVFICVATTAVVATSEITIGWLFNLLSLVAEGLHTGADLIDSLLALGLVMAAARPPDRSHPYGHGKYDSLAGLCEGLCVLASGIWATFSAARVLLGYVAAQPQPGLVPIIAMIITSIAYWFISGYVLRLARITHSPAVYAEALHLRTHVYITGGLFAGLVLSRIAEFARWPLANYIDPVMALLLGLLLIGIAARIMFTGVKQLLDTALPRENYDQLISTLAEFADEFVEVHAIRTRQAGTERHIDIHMVVAADATVAESHDLAHRIETRLAEVLPGLRLLVHIEPAVGELLRRYRARGRRGAVIADEDGVEATREATHHDHANPHQT